MLNGIDATIFYFFNKNCTSHFLDILMPILSEIGSGEGIFVLSFLPLLLAKGDKKKSAILLWAGLTVAYYITYFLKDSVSRPRPFLQLPDVRLLINEKSFSFPSSHATQSFMAATIASRCFRGGVLFFILATLVAISRMYLGVHYFSDVLAGAMLGTAIGYCLIYISNQSNNNEKI
ncbi:MAG: phosphatase PAP2 family protein [Candidatus Omnitrophica bacterium]|nr:phosphatase PAP2 family protein [Candidatus Omnitrophota bacterium]